jgi:hypothetical protein
MAEELGKIEKPSIEQFKIGRKLFFVPLVFSGKELPLEFLEKYNRYWQQVESQISNLEMKLGLVKHVFHELIAEGSDAGLKTLEKLNESSYLIVKHRIENGANLEATEDNEILAELMDWSRCLSIGLQSQKATSKIYEFYTEATQKRNGHILKRLNESLKENEIGILIMAEGHPIQFPTDISVFYVAPPALDEIKRWLRDYEARAKESSSEETQPFKPDNNIDDSSRN